MKSSLIQTVYRRQKIARFFELTLIASALLSLMIAVIHEYSPFSSVLTIPDVTLSYPEAEMAIEDMSIKGRDNQGRAYEIIADKAAQWLTQKKNYDFGSFSFTFPVSNMDQATLKSSHGTYNDAQKTLTFGSPVKLTLNQGQQFSAGKISFNLQKLTLEAKDDLLIDYEPLTVRAQSMTIDGQAQKITIKGRVRIKLAPWKELNPAPNN